MQPYKSVKLYDTVWSDHFKKFQTIRELYTYYNSIMECREQDLKNATANVAIRKANAEEFNHIVELAKSYGYKVNSYVTGTRKRKGYYKDEKWVAELRKYLPNNYYNQCDPERVAHNYTEFEKLYTEKRKELECVDENMRQHEARERENKKKDALAIRMAVKYGLPEEYTDRDSIVEALINLDKYIMLAWAMEETRGDWSDGFYRVSYAMGKFEVTSEDDKLIVADVWSCMDSDDGRVFRDTSWNYSVLYSMGNQELLADIRKIME